MNRLFGKLAVIGLLGTQVSAMAQSPAATLGPPRPAATLQGTVRPIVRASDGGLADETIIQVADTVGDDPWVKAPVTGPRTTYPPTYSSNRTNYSKLNLGGMLPRSTGKTESTPTVPAVNKQTYREDRRTVLPTVPELPDPKPTDLKNEEEPESKLAPPSDSKPTLQPDPKKLVPVADPKKSEPKLITPPESKPLPKTTTQAESKPTPRVIPTPAPTIIESRGTTIPSPAWRWYGYGTVMPGTNAASGDGNYPLAPLNWLQQSGATPGAIPKGLVVSEARRTLPDAPPTYNRIESVSRTEKEPDATDSTDSVIVLVPQLEEVPSQPTRDPIPTPGVRMPSLAPSSTPVAPRTTVPEAVAAPVQPEPEFVLPPRLPPTGAPYVQKDPRGGTTIFFQVPPTPEPVPKATFKGEIQPKPSPPISSRPGPTVPVASVPVDAKFLARGQAPTSNSTFQGFANNKPLVEKMETICRGAKEVRVTATHANRIVIQLVVSKPAEVEAMATRLAALPELAKFHLDFDIRVQ